MRYSLFLITGLILLAVSLQQLKQSIAFINSSERTTGIVTSLEEDDGAYSPVFAVQTKGGQIMYRHAYATNPSAWHIGEEANFLYDPQNPGSPRMVGYFWIFNWSIVFMAIAIPLIIIGAGYFLFNKLSRRANENYV
ncbi:MAG: DUF3592 domain-containing protein [Chitinophaga sp.]|uniref:DUF3592 domain-containing protein n=1 Tax=Chitinophaga sp. TaxID=1869181 RepID=UPI0025B84EAC|nr:DUF3592 domain-containing protein [Chitinophaga sp.]MBV8252350.1 DUF3592 domain-containing protein [Chitinophaga sp.]